MKKNTQKGKAKAKIPFFATILSKQELQYTTAGATTATAKVPSDKDETTLPVLDVIDIPPPPPPNV
jgi:hypothetical protein